MGTAHLSPHKRTRVVVWHEAGLTHKQIAEKEGIALGSITGIVKRYQVQTSGRNQAHARRPKSLNDRHLRQISREIAQNPFVSAKALIEKLQLPCCVATLIATLKQSGIEHTRAPGRRPKFERIKMGGSGGSGGGGGGGGGGGEDDKQQAAEPDDTDTMEPTVAG